MTYALDEDRKSIFRASFSRNAGQLTAVGTYIGYANPSSAAGWVEYPWVDSNGDHLAQTNEVLVNQPLLASGGGFNTANPTAVTSANLIDPDFKAPKSTGIIVGFDRELVPNFALQLNYTYGKVTEHPMSPFIGFATSDWQSLAPLVGTTPDGVAYNIPLFIPDRRPCGGQRRRTFADQLRRLQHDVQRHRSVGEQAHVEPLGCVSRLRGTTRRKTTMTCGGHRQRQPDSKRHLPAHQRRAVGAEKRRQRFGRRVRQPALELQHQRRLPARLEHGGCRQPVRQAGHALSHHVNAALGREGTTRILLTEELDTLRFEALGTSTSVGRGTRVSAGAAISRSSQTSSTC